MKTLIESLLDDEDVLLDKTGNKLLIEKFIKNNYILTNCKITITKDFKVNVDGDISFNGSDYLTNDLFTWGKVKGDFYCNYSSKKIILKSLKGAPEEVTGEFSCYNCSQLTSLEGAPKKIDGDFDCGRCNDLKSLIGVPEKIGGEFDCSCCNGLKTLEGAPKKIDGDFNCSYCDNLISLKGSPKKCWTFDCSYCNGLKTLEGSSEECEGSFTCHACKNLTSLAGAPKIVENDFYCARCKQKFTIDDIKKYSTVGGKIKN